MCEGAVLVDARGNTSIDFTRCGRPVGVSTTVDEGVAELSAACWRNALCKALVGARALVSRDHNGQPRESPLGYLVRDIALLQLVHRRFANVVASKQHAD